MNTLLQRFQHDFTRALRAPQARAPAWAQQPGFAVYRNTVMKGCIDALQANYPAIERLVGEAWFRAAAREFALRQWPSDVRLMLYGEGFADFLAEFAPAAELPYLSDVARLDRAWSEAHVAADAHALSATQLAALTPRTLQGLRLRPHPAARWYWFDAAPIYTLWSHNREGGVLDGELPWVGEGALLTRPTAAVQWRLVGRAACAFLRACAAQQTLAQALAAATEAEPTTNPSALLAELLRAGALSEGAPHEHPA